MTPVLYHKPFKGASHGDRFRYEITSETPKEVRWLRSDGLAGKCTRQEWDRLYVLAPKAKPAPNAPAPKKIARRRTR